MAFDVESHLGAVERTVSLPERDGQPASAVTLARSFIRWVHSTRRFPGFPGLHTRLSSRSWGTTRPASIEKRAPESAASRSNSVDSDPQPRTWSDQGATILGDLESEG